MSVSHRGVVSTYGRGRGKEGGSLKQISPRKLELMGLIAFIKISAATLNKSSTLMKSEEHYGTHPQCHLPFQTFTRARSLQRGLVSSTPHPSLPQVTGRKHVEHPARLRIPQRQARGCMVLFLNITSTKRSVVWNEPGCSAVQGSLLTPHN